MKGKIILSGFIAGLLVFGGFLAISVPSVSAQEEQRPRVEDSWDPANVADLYYVYVHIEKIYPHRLGYVVVYRRGISELATVYIPFEWFKPAVNRAQLVQLSSGNTWPGMTVFYRDGEFVRVRLQVARSFSHTTWGIMPSTVNLDNEFGSAETVDLRRNPRQ